MTILQQTREALRLRHDASTTERTYLDWIEQFIRFHKGPGGWRHPKDLGAPAVERRLTNLTAARHVVASNHSSGVQRLGRSSEVGAQS
jgi:hypothetical protein